MKKRLNLRIVLMAFVALSVMTSLVSAYGVGMMYSKEIPLELSPGASRDVTLTLQTLDEAEGLTLSLEVTAGEEVTKLMQEEYELEAGVEKEVAIKVEVPADAELGTIYPVTFSLKPVSLDEGGIALGTKLTKSFEILVVEQPEPEAASTLSSGYMVAIIVIAVLVLLWYVMQFLKKKRLI